MSAGPNAVPNTKGGAILTYHKNVYDLACTTAYGCKWTENKNAGRLEFRDYWSMEKRHSATSIFFWYAHIYAASYLSDV